MSLAPGNPFLAAMLAEATPDEAAKISAKLRGRKDNAPGAMASTNVLPQASLNQLTNQFDVTRIPIGKLEQMVRDPTIAFARYFIRAQILRARWMIQCSDAQVAAFVDQALREIYAPFVTAWLQRHDYGFQAMIKRFETKPGLDWTYADPLDETNPEKPVWDQQAIDPLIFKAPAVLHPLDVEPLWTTDGSFNGIKWKPRATVNASAGSVEATEYDIYSSFWTTNEKESVFGCSPHDEPVLTTNGYKFIGELNPKTDLLVSYEPAKDAIRRGGSKKQGFGFEVASRPYEGDLLTVKAGGKSTRVTPNHKLTVRWTKECERHWAVYLMRRGDNWRIGATKFNKEKSYTCSGISARMHAERADAAWILGVFDNKHDALFNEKLWSNHYKVPDLTFVANDGFLSEHCLNSDDLAEIWSQIDSSTGARELLAARKLFHEYPLYERSSTGAAGRKIQSGYRVKWTATAANLIPGLMEVPVDPGNGKTPEWHPIEIEREHFVGDVYSLDVETHHHYVSNGIITQNSLWGYPRIAYAYRFWWSFWFDWGLADRHFEKDADPPAIVYFPSDEPDTADGRSASEVALSIGDQARSNSTIALPSDPVTGDDGVAKAMRRWELSYAKGGGNFEVFESRFNQLRMMMLSAVMVPEEAFQAKGGAAGYNSTGQLQDSFQASQINLLAELDYEINRYLIPHLVAANFPDRQVKAVKVTKGFDTEDIELAKVIIQGAANRDVETLNLDMAAMLDAVGLPRLSAAEIAKKSAEAAAQAGAQVPDAVPASPGQAGVTQQGLYYNPREVIRLNESTIEDQAQMAFMADLTNTPALRDHVILGDAERLRNLWRTALDHDLSVATTLLHDFKDQIALDESYLERLLRRTKSRAYETASITRRALSSIMRRASTAEFERVGLTDFSWDPANSQLASRYLSERADLMVTSISNTTKEQVKTYLADLVRRNVPPEQMPQLLSAHFQMLSGWRSDQIVRTEVARAYNMATLLAAQEAGIKQVQALDAQLGPERSDPHCIARNGRIYTLEEAFRELEDEHPNGTLQFRILRKPVRVKRLPIPADAPTPLLASVDYETDEIVVELSEALPELDANSYMLRVVDDYLASSLGNAS